MEGTAKEIYEKYRGECVSYKGVVLRDVSIAGYTDNNYVILGSYENNLCIRAFSRWLKTVDERNYYEDICYSSYRFAKPKNIEII